MSNERVYIHELIDIRGTSRADYMQHMTANWVPIGMAERDQLCFGVWGTIGSTGRWPQVVNIWEHRDWHGLAAAFAHETGHPTMQDPSLAQWWAAAADFRRGGEDRLLVPAPWSRGIEALIDDGVQGAVYVHEIVQLVPDGAGTFLARVRDHGREVHAGLGMELVGAFENALVGGSECILIWACPSFDAWADYERAARRSSPLADWRHQIRDVALDWRRTLLVDAPLAPLRLHRQPTPTDRRPRNRG